jgi:hypothetical protein
MVRQPIAQRESDRVNETPNNKLYIHEYIDIIGHNRAAYMHHMTANWSPIAQDERNQLCFGVWGVVGSTRRWPEVINIWEEDGWSGLASSWEHEFNHPTLQDPKLAKWWAEAASYRSGGFDRILAPAPWMPTIGQLCADGVRGETYAHEHYWLPQGTSKQFLQAVADEAIAVYGRFGLIIAGAWETAMAGESECFLLWASPSWAQWGEFEAAQETDPASVRWRKRTYELCERQTRFLMVDAPLSPMRIGRQPSRDDRIDWED